MKIYVTAPNTKRAQLKVFYDAVDSLKKDGHKVINLYEENESVLENSDVDFFVKKYKESEKAIREADVLIADVTYPGRRIGYEIARALDERKVVIALYDSNSDATKVATLRGLKARSKSFYFYEYTKDSIGKTLKDTLDEAKSRLDTKFILIISPEIDRYLTWAADERRMHKAQIVRNSVEGMMETDKEYQAYLKSLDA